MKQLFIFIILSCLFGENYNIDSLQIIVKERLSLNIINQNTVDYANEVMKYHHRNTPDKSLEIGYDILLKTNNSSGSSHLTILFSM